MKKWNYTPKIGRMKCLRTGSIAHTKNRQGPLPPIKQHVCGVLNETTFQRIIYFTAWYPADENVWKDEEGLVLLREVCHLGMLLRLQRIMSLQVSFACTLLWVRWDAISQLLLKSPAFLATAIPSAILSWLCFWTVSKSTIKFLLYNGGRKGEN